MVFLLLQMNIFNTEMVCLVEIKNVNVECFSFDYKQYLDFF